VRLAGDRLFLVEDGRVEVVKRDDGSGQSFTLQRFLGPGEGPRAVLVISLMCSRV